jgi:hypothetical protein
MAMQKQKVVGVLTKKKVNAKAVGRDGWRVAIITSCILICKIFSPLEVYFRSYLNAACEK